MIKKIVRLFIVSLLATLSRGIIRKYHPKVIMITGSVGKTSTKDAIAAALTDTYFLRASEKSYNSEFGVPFTIIGVKAPWQNIFAWIRVFQEAFTLLLLPNHYPKLLVLEVGADKPGDITNILRIVTPDVVVVTRLPEVPVHVEAYTTPQAVREEDFLPAYALPPSAPLIISADDSYARDMAMRLPVRITMYGLKEDAFVNIKQPTSLMEDGHLRGMQADMIIHTSPIVTEKIIVRGALGRQQLFAPAAALAIAIALHTPIDDALSGLSSYISPPGRGRILDGINESTIIDESYNASPSAIIEALLTFRELKHATRRIAILGDMLELGRYSVSEHQRIGKLAVDCVDILVSVGVRARGITQAAQDVGFNAENIYHFDTAKEAGISLAKLARQGDIFLIKGSQNVRLERVAEALLKNADDSVYLPRQDREWKRRL